MNTKSAMSLLDLFLRDFLRDKPLSYIKKERIIQSMGLPHDRPPLLVPVPFNYVIETLSRSKSPASGKEKSFLFLCDGGDGLDSLTHWKIVHHSSQIVNINNHDSFMINLSSRI